MNIIDQWVNDIPVMSVVSDKNISLICPHTADIAALPMLNIGCGTHIMEGWVNSDVRSHPGVDCVFDSQYRWPFADHSVKSIYASHVIEHLDNPEAFFDEALRCLHPQGALLIRIPHPMHTHSMGDLDHKRTIPLETFFWLGMKGDETHNLKHLGKQRRFIPKVILHVYNDRSFFNHWFVPKAVKRWCVNHLWNTCMELIVWLKPQVQVQS